MAKARVTQYIVEAAYPIITRSPTTITGAGVSGYGVEVAYAMVEAAARVSQYDVEVAYSMATEGAGGSIAGSAPSVHVHGYAS